MTLANICFNDIKESWACEVLVDSGSAWSVTKRHVGAFERNNSNLMTFWSWQKHKFCFNNI